VIYFASLDLQVFWVSGLTLADVSRIGFFFVLMGFLLITVFTRRKFFQLNAKFLEHGLLGKPVLTLAEHNHGDPPCSCKLVDSLAIDLKYLGKLVCV